MRPNRVFRENTKPARHVPQRECLNAEIGSFNRLALS